MWASVMKALAPMAINTGKGMANEYRNNPNPYQPGMAHGGYADGGAINSPYNGQPEGQMSIMPYPMPGDTQQMPHYAHGGSMYHTLNQLSPINQPPAYSEYRHGGMMHTMPHHYAMGGYAHSGMPHMGIGGFFSGLASGAKNMFSGLAKSVGPQAMQFAKNTGQNLLSQGAQYAGQKAGDFIGSKVGGDYGQMAQNAISGGINKYGNQALNQGLNYAGNKFGVPQQPQQQQPQMQMFRGGYATGGAPMMSLRDASEMMPQHDNEAIFAPQQSHFSHGGGMY
jgi:hypothetical protein